MNEFVDSSVVYSFVPKSFFLWVEFGWFGWLKNTSLQSVPKVFYLLLVAKGLDIL